MVKYITSFFNLLKDSFKEWNNDNAPRLAAALAYHTAFSIAPLLVIVIGVVGIIANENSVRTDILSSIRTELGPDAAELVESLIINRQMTGGAGVLPTLIGVVALLFGATGVFRNLQAALDEIWNVNETEQKGGVKGLVKDRLLTFGMLLVVGFLLLVSLIISTLLSALDSFISGLLPATQLFLEVLSVGISFGIVTMLFALIFKFLPHADIEWRDVIIGAAVTSLLFTIGKTLLSMYLARSSTASVYGAAGAFVLILLWVYYSAQIVLFGAEFTQVFARKYGSKIVPDGLPEEESDVLKDVDTQVAESFVNKQHIQRHSKKLGLAEVIFGVGVLILGVITSRFGSSNN